MTKAATAASPIHGRYFLKPDGGWTDEMAREISNMPPEHQAAWLALLDHLADEPPHLRGDRWKNAQAKAELTCFGHAEYPQDGITLAKPGTEAFYQELRKAGPGVAWFEELRSRATRIAEQDVGPRLASWIRAATRSNVALLNRPCPNRTMLRSMLWASTLFAQTSCVDALRELGAFATSHNTAQGVIVALVLGCVETHDSVAALHMLARSAKRQTPRHRFQTAASHVGLRLGLSTDDAAERFIPSYGFNPAGTRSIDFGTVRAEAQLEGLRVKVEWLSDGGKLLKALPAGLRKSDSAGLAELKGSLKATGAMLLTQRDRLEQLMRVPRAWRFANFKAYYLEHPLVGHLARKLIWTVDDLPVLFTAAGAIDADGACARLAERASVRLWHPLGRPDVEIRRWHKRLDELEITQPFKQAHREIYILTEAERRTQTYSNRFAGHILRQHQFAQLARGRGWEYALQGCWDSGSRGAATIQSPQSALRAEYWVNPVAGDHAQSGITLQIASDQVRFYRNGEPDPVPMDQIPPLVFSEMMRDVDLFVGVASVGNDPTWQDGGPDGRFRGYWHDFSFGKLGATAQTRRTVLESLLPRLSKIRERCSLSDRFLVVRGDLRTYKIHLGSGNILMEPNDQYLCIVPSRSTSDGASDVFLPFEGDATLSVILSKAFLLAEDRKIKDPTITRQIVRE